MQKVIRSRKNCSNRLIIPNIRNLQYFGLYYQYSASIPVYLQDLWGIYVRENSFFAGFITHSPTISRLYIKSRMTCFEDEMNKCFEDNKLSSHFTYEWIYQLQKCNKVSKLKKKSKRFVFPHRESNPGLLGESQLS